MIRLVCVAVGYIFGLFQTSYLYGRMKGMDIREHGSGNAGATNALRTPVSYTHLTLPTTSRV